MKLGEILALLREERGIGQRELAGYLNVTAGTISNYAHNIHSPDPVTLCRLAEYFGVTTDYLMGRTPCRFDPSLLERRISDEYTVTDIVNTVLALDSCSVDHLMDYADFLRSRQ